MRNIRRCGDIVERLRARGLGPKAFPFPQLGPLMDEAADEIERLRAVLQEVRDLNDLMDPDIEDIARRALEGKP